MVSVRLLMGLGLTTATASAFVLEKTYDFGNGVWFNLAHKRGGGDLFVANVLGNVQYSADGGSSWTDVSGFDGIVNALGVGEHATDLLVGSQTVGQLGNTSYAYFSSELGHYEPAGPLMLDGAPLPSAPFTYFDQLGISWRGGIWYASVAAGGRYMGTSADNGKTWNLKAWYTEEFAPYSFRFFDEHNGVAIGGQHWEGDPQGSTLQDYIGAIAVTNDGGSTWREVFRHDEFYTFNGIDCLGDTCWAVAGGLGSSQNQGHVFMSTDRGQTWEVKFSDYGGLRLFEILAVNEREIYAGGNFGAPTAVVVSTDGGLSWEYAFEPAFSGPTAEVYGMYDVAGAVHVLAGERDIKTSIYSLKP